MPEAVYWMLALWCTLVVACPTGTNLGLLHLLWMQVNGRLLGARGAVFPHPQPTPGRLRRALAHTPFPHDRPLPTRIRAKAAVISHLPTGCWHQRRQQQPDEPIAPQPTPLDRAA